MFLQIPQTEEFLASNRIKHTKPKMLVFLAVPHLGVYVLSALLMDEVVVPAGG